MMPFILYVGSMVYLLICLVFTLHIIENKNFKHYQLAIIVGIFSPLAVIAAVGNCFYLFLIWFGRKITQE